MKNRLLFKDFFVKDWHIAEYLIGVCGFSLKSICEDRDSPGNPMYYFKGSVALLQQIEYFTKNVKPKYEKEENNEIENNEDKNIKAE